MAVIRNNNFSDDTDGHRVERLITIQGNLSVYQPLINPPAHIVTWALNCYDVYSDIIATQGVEFNESKGATTELIQKEEILQSEYQNARGFGLTIYKNMNDYLVDYGFDTGFPIRRADKLAKVEKVLETYARHSADGITPLLPELIINRLSDAVNVFKATLKNQAKDKSDARHALTVANERFNHDTQMLNELKYWWFAMMGKKDERINIIGMVNPKTGRRGRAKHSD